MNCWILGGAGRERGEVVLSVKDSLQAGLRDPNSQLGLPFFNHAHACERHS